MVHGHRPLEAVPRDLKSGAVNAGVVDEHVEPREPRPQSLSHAAHVLEQSEIADFQLDLGAPCCVALDVTTRRLTASAVAADHHDLGAAGGQQPAGRKPHTGIRPGHDADLGLKLGHARGLHPPPNRVPRA